MNKRSATLALGILISAFALYFAVRGIDGPQLWSALTAAQLIYALPLLAMLFAFYALKLLRWQILLAAPPAGPTRAMLIGPMTIGFAANNILPFRVGELIRIVLASRSTGISKSTILGSLVVERLFDIIAILLLGAVSLAGVTGRQQDLPFETYYLPIAMTTILLIFLAALFSKSIVRSGKFLLRPLPARAYHYLGARFDSIEQALVAVRSPWRILLILVNSVLQWALLGLTILLACLAVGVQIPLVGTVYVMILITIGVSLPSTPGFVGVIEYCFVLALSAFMVPAEQALAAAIFYHVLAWASITCAGTIYLHKQALSWGSMRGAASTR